MTGDTTVSVYEQLTSGETGITSRAADDEPAGAVDVELSIFINQLGGNDFLNNFFDNIVSNLFIRDIIIMLGGDDDVSNSLRFTLAVFNRHQ